MYFEFFAKPYDKHTNPSETKGVLFDTNSTYNESAIWEMFEGDYVAAYGELRAAINYIKEKRYCFSIP
ncbi:MAG: hypothetical protein CSA45_01625 [Gammaproteobacteria bacterium]|nr:MAG: hypothetical protein CSA45_01625 [Gammaproteobacteria bacterium]